MFGYLAFIPCRPICQATGWIQISCIYIYFSPYFSGCSIFFLKNHQNLPMHLKHSWFGFCFIIKTQQDILRCIRPPQSQSVPNIFLKTSVCAEGSQQLPKTNRINKSYTKSLRIFLRHFYICVAFWSFFIYKTLFLDFIKKNPAYGRQTISRRMRIVAPMP